MLARTRAKLASRRGASLSLALLLFLVCTVVASVVITAGSAAAGRMSQLEDADKSYYNVTSAAELFWNELEDSDGVTIKCGCSATRGSDGTYTISRTPNYWVSVDGLDVVLGRPTSLSTMFQAAAVDLIFGTPLDKTTTPSLTSPSVTLSSTEIIGSLPSLNADPAALTPKGMGIAQEYEVFQITSDDARFDPVNVKVTRDTDGSLIFCFYEDDAASFNVVITAGVDLGVDKPWDTHSVAGALQCEATVTWTPQSLKLGGDAS